MEGCLALLFAVAICFAVFSVLAVIINWGVDFVFNYDLGFWKAFVIVFLLWIVGRILFPSVGDK